MVVRLGLAASYGDADSGNGFRWDSGDTLLNPPYSTTGNAI